MFTLLNLNSVITQFFSNFYKQGEIDKPLSTYASKWFFLFIFIYQVIFIFQGLDLSDEGFLAAYYQQFFNNPESVQYNFMFWLTGLIGGSYFKVFSFLGLWGLRLGGVLVTTGTAFFVYSLLKKYLNPNYLKLGIFLIIIALNNDIKELNYNNISALVYVAVIFYLLNGLKEQSYLKLFVSGLFVALNVFIRPPNLLELGLVLAIIYYGYSNKESLKIITKQIFCFLSGFLATSLILIFVIYLTGFWNVFVNALQIVFKMGSGGTHIEVNSDNSYGILKLLSQLKSNNVRAILISFAIFSGLVFGISILSSIKKEFVIFHKISRLLKYCFIFLVFVLIYQGVIDNYSILFFYSGLIVILFVLAHLTSNDFDTKFLMFCGCFILVTFPFGSSAGILTAGRYSFWIGLPVSINYLFNIRSVKNQFNLYRGDSESSLHLVVTENQVAVAKRLFLVILVGAGLFHSYAYPFFDKRSRIEMRYSIDNKFLRGIYTTKKRAAVMNELLQESSKYVKKGDYVLAYDCIPLYHFLTETIPYMRNPYPWLYETEIFKNELALAERDKKQMPVVVMQLIKTIGDGSKWPEESLPTNYFEWDANKGRNKYLNEFLTKHNYREVWNNQYFKILIPK